MCNKTKSASNFLFRVLIQNHYSYYDIVEYIIIIIILVSIEFIVLRYFYTIFATVRTQLKMLIEDRKMTF